MSNAGESKYKFFDKRCLVFPDEDCLGKKVFYANTYTMLVSDIESGDFDRTGLIEEVKPYEQRPFKIRDERDDFLWKQLAYYDPNYEARIAYSQGRTIEFRRKSDSEWHVSADGVLDTECFEYRVKP